MNYLVFAELIFSLSQQKSSSSQWTIKISDMTKSILFDAHSNLFKSVIMHIAIELMYRFKDGNCRGILIIIMQVSCVLTDRYGQIGDLSSG